MKKLKLLFVLVLLSTTLIAQELSDVSKYLRDNRPEVYKNIKTFSNTLKFTGSHNFKVSERVKFINAQSESFSEVIDILVTLANREDDVLFTTLNNSILECAINEANSMKPVSSAVVDWTEVIKLYEIKRCKLIYNDGDSSKIDFSDLEGKN